MIFTPPPPHTLSRALAGPNARQPRALYQITPSSSSVTRPRRLREAGGADRNGQRKMLNCAAAETFLERVCRTDCWEIQKQQSSCLQTKGASDSVSFSDCFPLPKPFGEKKAPPSVEDFPPPHWLRERSGSLWLLSQREPLRTVAQL